MLIEFGVLALAVATISLTVTKSSLFEGVRNFFFNFSTNPVMNWIHDLISCPWCFSHWVAFVVVAIWQPRLTDCGFWLADMVVSAFAMTALSGVFWSTIFNNTK
jgi:hypothetical protein